MQVRPTEQMRVEYAQACARSSANQGHIAAGQPVWLLLGRLPGAPLVFTERLSGREIKNHRQPCVVTILTTPHPDHLHATTYTPSGRSAIKPHRN